MAVWQTNNHPQKSVAPAGHLSSDDPTHMGDLARRDISVKNREHGLARAIGVTGFVLAVTLGSSLVAAAARAQSAPQSPSTSATISPTGALAQYWQSTGYGMYLDLTPERAVLHQTSAGGCLPLASSKHISITPTSVDMEATRIAGVGYFIGKMDIPMARDHTTEGTQLHMDLGKVNAVEFSPVEALPGTCETPLRNTRLNTFDMFWHYFDENYAFFTERGVDWDALRAKYRPQVVAGVSRRELYDITHDMLVPLGDGHVTLGTLRYGQTDMGHYPGWSKGLEDSDFEKIVKATVTTRVTGELQQIGDTISYGITPENLGYMSIIGMDGALLDADFPGEMAQMLDQFAEVDALVIDARINFGGDDTLGYALASYFTDQTVSIGSKAVYDKGDWHELGALEIAPAARQFDRPVYLLTSGMTISAAETFALALSQFDNVTLVGSPTNGVLSDMFFLALPNGWLISLSNERYLDAQGQNFEAKGVPVDVAVPVSPSDMVLDVDPVYARVLADLRGR